MIKFLFLILVALIVFPVVLIFVKKIDLKTKLIFLIGGYAIALLGMLVQSTLSFYYAILIMIGLVFAGAVLISKQLENQMLAEEESFIEVPQTIQEAIEKPTEPYVEPAVPESEIKNVDWLTPSKKEEQ